MGGSRARGGGRGSRAPRGQRRSASTAPGKERAPRAGRGPGGRARGGAGASSHFGLLVQHAGDGDPVELLHLGEGRGEDLGGAHGGHLPAARRQVPVQPQPCLRACGGQRAGTGPTAPRGPAASPGDTAAQPEPRAPRPEPRRPRSHLGVQLSARRPQQRQQHGRHEGSARPAGGALTPRPAARHPDLRRPHGPGPGRRRGGCARSMGGAAPRRPPAFVWGSGRRGAAHVLRAPLRTARLRSALPGGETRGGGGAGRGGRRGGAGEGRARQSTAKRDETSRVPGRCPRSERRPLRGGVGTAGRKGCAHPRGGGGREAAPRSKQQQTAARTGCLRAADALPSLLLPPAPPGRSVNVKAAVAGPLWGAALCRVRSVAVGAAGRAAVGALRSQRGPSAGTASRGADGASETERLGYTTETAASDRRYCSEGLPQRLISDRGTKGGGQRGSAPL